MNATTRSEDLAAAIVADPRARLPLAQRFLAGWFHEDWSDDTPRWQDAVEEFVATSSRPTVVATLAELRDLSTARLDEATLAGVLEQLDCALVPTGVGLDATSWLDAVISLMDR